MSSWIIREGNVVDKPQILELLKIVFPDLQKEKGLEKYWDWEFIDCPYGKAKIFLADDHGKIVGHYAVIPLKYHIYDSQRIGGLVVDVMTHPGYRNQGMFVKLGEYALSHTPEIDFFIGFPTRKDVLPGHLKVGWENIGSMYVYAKAINFSKVASFITKKKIIRSLISILLKTYSAIRKTKLIKGIKIDNDKTDFINTFKYSLMVDKKNYLMRTKKFYKWKFLDNPYRNYSISSSFGIQNYLITRNIEYRNLNTKLIIGFPESIQEKTLPLLQYIIERGKEENDIILCLLTENYQIIRILKQNGFIRSGEKYDVIIHKKEMKSIPLMDFKRWIFNWTDIDVV